MSADLVTVRITASQLVKYDQYVEMPREEWAKIERALAEDSRGSRTTLLAALEAWVDVADIDDAEEMEPDDANFTLQPEVET